MATTYNNVQLGNVDASGNVAVVYPVTKSDLVRINYTDHGGQYYDTISSYLSSNWFDYRPISQTVYPYDTLPLRYSDLYPDVDDNGRIIRYTYLNKKVIYSQLTSSSLSNKLNNDEILVGWDSDYNLFSEEGSHLDPPYSEFVYFNIYYWFYYSNDDTTRVDASDYAYWDLSKQCVLKIYINDDSSIPAYYILLPNGLPPMSSQYPGDNIANIQYPIVYLNSNHNTLQMSYHATGRSNDPYIIYLKKFINKSDSYFKIKFVMGCRKAT